MSIWVQRDLVSGSEKKEYNAKFTCFNDRILSCDVCEIGQNYDLKLTNEEGLFRVWSSELKEQLIMTMGYRTLKETTERYTQIILPSAEFQSGTSVFGLCVDRFFDKQQLKMNYSSGERRISLRESSTGAAKTTIDFRPNEPFFKIEFEPNWSGRYKICLEEKCGDDTYAILFSTFFRICNLEKNNIQLENPPGKKYLVSCERFQHRIRAQYSFGQAVGKAKVEVTIRPDVQQSDPILTFVKEGMVSVNRNGDFDIPLALSSAGIFHYDIEIEDEHGRKGTASGNYVVSESLVKVRISSSPKSKEPEKPEEEDTKTFGQRKKKKKRVGVEDSKFSSVESELYRVSVNCNKASWDEQGQLPSDRYNTKNEVVIRVYDCFGEPEVCSGVHIRMISEKAAFVNTGNLKVKSDNPLKITEVELKTDKYGESRVAVASSEEIFQIEVMIVTSEGFKISRTTSLYCLPQKDYTDVYISKFDPNMYSSDPKSWNPQHVFKQREVVRIKAIMRRLDSSDHGMNPDEMKLAILDFNGIVDTFTSPIKGDDLSVEMFYMIPDRLVGRKIRIQTLCSDTEHVINTGEGIFEVEHPVHYFTPELLKQATAGKEIVPTGEKMEFHLRWEHGLKEDSKLFAFRRDVRLEKGEDLAYALGSLDFEKLDPTFLRRFNPARFDDYEEIIRTRNVMSGEVSFRMQNTHSYAFIRQMTKPSNGTEYYRLFLVICGFGKSLTEKRIDTISLFLSQSIENSTSARLIRAMSEVQQVYVREYSIIDPRLPKKKKKEEEITTSSSKIYGSGTFQLESYCLDTQPITPSIIFPSLMDWFKTNLPWMVTGKIEVTIKTITGRSVLFQVEVTDTIQQLKEKICEKLGSEYHPSVQRLLFGGKQLMDGRSIGDYGIGIDSSVVYLVRRLRGGVQVFVRDLLGKIIAIETNLGTTVEGLKVLIQEKTGIDPMYIRLLHEGKDMSDSYSLEDYHIRAESVIDMVLRFSGGGSSSGDISIISRNNFVDVDYVEVNLLKGQKQCVVVMDATDSITEYNIDFIILNEFQVGCLPYQKVRVVNPVFTQLEHPVEMTLKDEVGIRSVVENLSDERLCDLFVSFGENEHLEFFGDASEMVQKIPFIEPRSAMSLLWPARPKQVGKVRFDVDLVYKSRIVDKIVGGERSLFIKPYGMPEIESSNLFLGPNGIGSMDVDLNGTEQTAHMILSLVTCTGSVLLDCASRIAEYPHGCCEQTFSSTLPNIVLYEFLERTKTLKADQQKKLLVFMSAGRDMMLKKYVNVETGGVGLWDKKNVSVFHTALALSLFGRLSQYVMIDGDVLSKMAEFLLKCQKEDGGFDHHKGDYTPFPSLLTRFATTAYILQSLSFIKLERGPVRFNEIVNSSGTMKPETCLLLQKSSTGALEWMKSMVHEYEDDVTVMGLVLDCLTRFPNSITAPFYGFGEVLAGRILSMQKEDGSWLNKSNSSLTSAAVGNMIENTSYCVLALGRFDGILGERSDPQFKKSVAKGIGYILSKRTSKGFESTRDTCYAILALSEFAGSVLNLPDGESEEDPFVTIHINGEIEKEYKFLKSLTNTECLDLSYKMRDIYFPIEKMKSSEKNVIEVKSSGMFVQCLMETHIYRCIEPLLPKKKKKKKKEEEEEEEEGEGEYHHKKSERRIHPCGQLRARLDRNRVKIGDVVSCVVEFTPVVSQEALVMEIPIPCGLQSQELKFEDNSVENYEIRDGTVVCYLAAVSVDVSVVITVLCKAVYVGKTKQQDCKCYNMYSPIESLALFRNSDVMEVM